MKDHVLVSIRLLVVFTLLLGFAYPAAVWAVGRVAFPREAGGSFVARDGKVRSLDVVLGPPAARPLRFRRVTDPTPLQTAIFEGWLKGTTSPN